VRPRYLALALSLVPALAQVGLLDGPRPPTEVRGTLEGNPRDGYKVAVEFLVDQGVEPLQGTVYQTLSWNGTLYLCPGGVCDTFRLAGYVQGTPYNQVVFDLYDSQNRFRGRAGVNTVYDTQDRPAYYQVEYAVSPLQGTRVWRPSPDNPVPVEAGGWLSATPPGGVRPERYRYPGLEGYQPPQGSAFSSISLADRDVVEVVRVDSLALLRQVFGRAERGSTLYLYVPDVSPWTQRLAQEWGSQVGGQARFVVPEGTARAYCATPARRDPRYYVMPRESLPPEASLGVAYPPSGQGQPGMVLAGAGLYRDPGWPETDYVDFTTALIPLTEGLPQARARVWGYTSRADLKARVEFYGRVLSSGYDRYASGQVGTPWDGRFTADVGRGPETFQLQNWQEGDYSNTIFYAKDDQGRDRAFVYVTTRKETVYELDTSRPTDFSLWTVGGPNSIRFTVAGETFESYNCSLSNRTSDAYYYTCSYRDLQGRYRGGGSVVIAAMLDITQVSGTVYPLVARTRTVGYTYGAYIKGWSQTWRYATDNDRPVEAGGYVTSEGKRYQIPGLEGYLLPTGKDIEAAEGDPYVSYITRSISPDQAPLGGTGRTEARVWFKPLSDWCREKGL
jgi:hypothetical protein